MKDWLQCDGVLYEVLTGRDRRLESPSGWDPTRSFTTLVRGSDGADRLRAIVDSAQPGMLNFRTTEHDVAAAFDRMVADGEVELVAVSRLPLATVFRHGESEAPPEASLTELAASHFVEFRFIDTQGNPVGGLDYVFHAPDGGEAPGTLGKDGRIRRDHIEDGTYGVELKAVLSAAWASLATPCDEPVVLGATVSGCSDGTKLTVRLFREFSETDDDVIETLEGEVQDGVLALPWVYDYAADESRAKEQGDVRFIAEVALDNGSWAKTLHPLVVTLKTIADVDWDLDEVGPESPVQLMASVAGFSSDATATIAVLRLDARGESQTVATLSDLPLSDGKVRADWTSPDTPGELFFEVTIDDGVPRTAVSDFLNVTRRQPKRKGGKAKRAPEA